MRCITRVAGFGGWHFHQCHNEAKHGPHCGVHAPEKIAARKAKRGPTLFEREMNRSEARRKKLDALLAAARTIIERWEIGYEGVEEGLSDLREALKAYGEKT